MRGELFVVFIFGNLMQYLQASPMKYRVLCSPNLGVLVERRVVIYGFVSSSKRIALGDIMYGMVNIISKTLLHI